MKIKKIVVNGHGWNRHALRTLVGVVSLLSVALAVNAGTHSVHTAGSVWGPSGSVWGPAGSVWGPTTG